MLSRELQTASEELNEADRALEEALARGETWGTSSRPKPMSVKTRFLSKRSEGKTSETLRKERSVPSSGGHTALDLGDEHQLAASRRDSANSPRKRRRTDDNADLTSRANTSAYPTPPLSSEDHHPRLVPISSSFPPECSRKCTQHRLLTRTNQYPLQDTNTPSFPLNPLGPPFDYELTNTVPGVAEMDKKLLLLTTRRDATDAPPSGSTRPRKRRRVSASLVG